MNLFQMQLWRLVECVKVAIALCVLVLKTSAYPTNRNIDTYPAMRNIKRSAATPDLDNSFLSDYDYVLGSDPYVPRQAGTDKVLILEGSVPSSGNAVTNGYRNSLNNVLGLDSAAVFLRGYGATAGNIYSSGLGGNRGWNGGSDYASYYGYKPVQG